jgi:anhydro-N-acetylmuramic acid kinase
MTGNTKAEAGKGGVLTIVGLMSGTSLDGVDAALLETDGEDVVRPGPALSRPYGARLRALLRQALDEAPRVAPGATVPAAIREAEMRLTEAHGDAVRSLLALPEADSRGVDYLGFHGQTILHRPGERRTWQLGDGRALARETGIRVVNDFRAADVAAGGQGAPFVPLYHAALVRRLGAREPVAILNLGGVANVTFVSGETLLAFDTGPGNAALDDWALQHTGEPMDRDGALARKGAVNDSVLSAMLEHSYFAKPPPKSLDRMDFGRDAVAWLSPADGAATLTAFTAACVRRAAAHLPAQPARWIACGGGRHNPALMEALAIFLDAPLCAAEDVGWRGDFLEAEAFAYLAARSVKGLPLSLPSTTGVPKPMTGGRLHIPA